MPQHNPPKPKSVDKKLGNIYFEEMCLLWGPLTLSERTQFSVSTAEKIIAQCTKPKKPQKIKLTVLAEALKLSKRKMLGSKPPIQEVKFDSVKHFYHFQQSNKMVIISLQLPSKPKSVAVFEFEQPLVAKSLSEKLQYASEAPKHSLKNPIPSSAESSEIPVSPPHSYQEARSSSSSSSSDEQIINERPSANSLSNVYDTPATPDTPVRGVSAQSKSSSTSSKSISLDTSNKMSRLSLSKQNVDEARSPKPISSSRTSSAERGGHQSRQEDYNQRTSTPESRPQASADRNVSQSVGRETRQKSLDSTYSHKPEKIDEATMISELGQVKKSTTQTSEHYPNSDSQLLIMSKDKKSKEQNEWPMSLSSLSSISTKQKKNHQDKKHKHKKRSPSRSSSSSSPSSSEERRFKNKSKEKHKKKDKSRSRQSSSSSSSSSKAKRIQGSSIIVTNLCSDEQSSKHKKRKSRRHGSLISLLSTSTSRSSISSNTSSRSASPSLVRNSGSFRRDSYPRRRSSQIILQNDYRKNSLLVLASGKFQPFNNFLRSRENSKDNTAVCSICGYNAEGNQRRVEMIRSNGNGGARLTSDGTIYMYSKTLPMEPLGGVNTNYVDNTGRRHHTRQEHEHYHQKHQKKQPRSKSPKNPDREIYASANATYPQVRYEPPRGIVTASDAKRRGSTIIYRCDSSSSSDN